ncbi:MAG TPA: amidohydrolase family protein, partial [Candidatus Angelobacter sp.]|nr:amidohydrolase family protein [Candidatus Angelobacter sp.]
MHQPFFRLGLLAFCALTAICCAQTAPQPELLLIHGKIVTLDPARPSAQAVAIAGDRIVWLGSDAEAQKRFPTVNRKIDLRGAAVLPGIIDAHTHMFELGRSLMRLNLKGVATEEDVVARVRQRAAAAQPGEWILGWGWDEGKWAAHYPDNEALSRASPRNPVYLVGLHSFAAW